MQPQQTFAPIVEIGDKQYALVRNILGGQTSIVWKAIPLPTDWTKDTLLGTQARDQLRSTIPQEHKWRGATPEQYVAIKVAKTDADVEGLRQEARVLTLFKGGTGYVQLVQDATESNALIPVPCLVLEWASGTQVDALPMPRSEIEISAFLFRMANALSAGRRRAPAIILTDTIKGSSIFWKWDETQQDGDLTLMDLNRFANQDNDFRTKTLIRLGALTYTLATGANFEIDVANDRVNLDDIGKAGKENWSKLSLGLRSLIIRLLTRDFSGANSGEIALALRDETRLLFNLWRDNDLMRDLSSKSLLEQTIRLDIAEKRNLIIPASIDKPLLYAQVLSQYQAEARGVLAGDFLHWMTNSSSAQQVAKALILLEQTQPIKQSNAPLQPLPELKSEQIAEGFLQRAHKAYEQSRTILEDIPDAEDRDVLESQATGLRLQALLDVEQAQRHMPQAELPEWVMTLKTEQVAYELRKGQEFLQQPETVAKAVQILEQALTRLPNDVDAQRAYHFAYALWQAQVAGVSEQFALQVYWLQTASTQTNLPEWATTALQQAEKSLQERQNNDYQTSKAAIAKQLDEIIKKIGEASSEANLTTLAMKNLVEHASKTKALNESLESLANLLQPDKSQPNILQQITNDLSIAVLLQAISQANSREELDKITISTENETVKKAKQVRIQALQLNQITEDVLSQKSTLDQMILGMNSVAQQSQTISQSVAGLHEATSKAFENLKETIENVSRLTKPIAYQAMAEAQTSSELNSIPDHGDSQLINFKEERRKIFANSITYQPRPWWQHPATVAALSSLVVFVMCVFVYSTWLKPLATPPATPTAQNNESPIQQEQVNPPATSENQPVVDTPNVVVNQPIWELTESRWEDAGNHAVFRGILRNPNSETMQIELTFEKAEPCASTVPPSSLPPNQDVEICLQTTGTAPDYLAPREISLQIKWVNNQQPLTILLALEDFTTQPETLPAQFSLTELNNTGLPIDSLPNGTYLLQWFYGSESITSTSSITATYQITTMIDHQTTSIDWIPESAGIPNTQGDWKVVIYRQPSALQAPRGDDALKVREYTFDVYQTGFDVAFAADKTPLDGLHTLVITNTSALADTASLQLFLTNTVGYSATINYTSALTPTKPVEKTYTSTQLAQPFTILKFAPGERREIQVEITGKAGAKPTTAYLLSASVQPKTSNSEAENSQTDVVRVSFLEVKLVTSSAPGYMIITYKPLTPISDTLKIEVGNFDLPNDVKATWTCAVENASGEDVKENVCERVVKSNERVILRLKLEKLPLTYAEIRIPITIYEANGSIPAYVGEWVIPAKK